MHNDPLKGNAITKLLLKGQNASSQHISERGSKEQQATVRDSIKNVTSPRNTNEAYTSLTKLKITEQKRVV